MASKVREKIGLDVQVVLGPHPVTWDIQANTIGVEESTELHISAVGLALEMIENGDAICLGEVGRPHYHVSEDRWERANDMLLEIMRMASSAKSPIQLHEDNGHQTCADMASLCDKAGLPRNRAVRHFASSDLSQRNTQDSRYCKYGQGSIEGICSSIELSKSHWGMETDFLDDPRRPGAVLGPRTIPKRTNQLCKALRLMEWDDEKIEQCILDVHEN